MTVCGSAFFILSFPPVEHNLSTIWKTCWVLGWLLAFLQDYVMKGAEGREPGIRVFVYLWLAGLSPRVAGPTVHFYILHLLEEPAGPSFEQEFWPVLAVWVAGVCLDYLCPSP